MMMKINSNTNEIPIASPAIAGIAIDDEDGLSLFDSPILVHRIMTPVVSDVEHS
jgi:hypothetical protein